VSIIGAVVSRGGNTVELLGQGDAARTISGALVVLAVPTVHAPGDHPVPVGRGGRARRSPDLALLLAVLLRHRRWSSRW
jgi:hypothetical protein